MEPLMKTKLNKGDKWNRIRLFWRMNTLIISEGGGIPWNETPDIFAFYMFHILFYHWIWISPFNQFIRHLIWFCYMFKCSLKCEFRKKASPNGLHTSSFFISAFMSVVVFCVLMSARPLFVWHFQCRWIICEKIQNVKGVLCNIESSRLNTFV